MLHSYRVSRPDESCTSCLAIGKAPLDNLIPGFEASMLPEKETRPQSKEPCRGWGRPARTGGPGYQSRSLCLCFAALYGM